MISTTLDIEVLAKIVDQTGATIDNLRLFVRDDYYEKTVVDIAVLWFPDLEEPYFKVCELKSCLPMYCFQLVLTRGTFLSSTASS